MRIGMGYDVHKLVDNRPLIIGGVNIPYEKGLLGHSDADVLAHAIMDSILGAAGLGDIGKHFPDTDERYKGADSLYLMACVKKLLDETGYPGMKVMQFAFTKGVESDYLLHKHTYATCFCYCTCYCIPAMS